MVREGERGPTREGKGNREGGGGEGEEITEKGGRKEGRKGKGGEGGERKRKRRERERGEKKERTSSRNLNNMCRELNDVGIGARGKEGGNLVE